MRHVGLEPTEIMRISGEIQTSGLVNGAVNVEPEGDLRAIVEAWGQLPEPIKIAVVALVKAGTTVGIGNNG